MIVTFYNVLFLLILDHLVWHHADCRVLCLIWTCWRLLCDTVSSGWIMGCQWGADCSLEAWRLIDIWTADTCCRSYHWVSERQCGNMSERIFNKGARNTRLYKTNYLQGGSDNCWQYPQLKQKLTRCWGLWFNSRWWSGIMELSVCYLFPHVVPDWNISTTLAFPLVPP